MNWLYEAHRERARSGVRWWRILGVGFWVRDTRKMPRRAYDPHSFRLPRFRVAVFYPRLHRRRNERRRVRHHD